MSWSINLSGPPSVVTRQIADALILLDKALDYAQNSDADVVNVALNGYVSWNENEDIVGSSVGFSVSETTASVSPENGQDLVPASPAY